MIEGIVRKMSLNNQHQMEDKPIQIGTLSRFNSEIQLAENLEKNRKRIKKATMKSLKNSQ